MNYNEALQQINPFVALKALNIKGNEQGAYIYFPCPNCEKEAVIKAHGEKKNLWYCPHCKLSGHIISLAMSLRQMEYQAAKELLIEKASAPQQEIDKELSLKYELEYCDYLEKQGISKELCESLEVGKPKGKTMLAGCIAFTVWDENRKKVAYYGIRITDHKHAYHKSFNPELYLYNFNSINAEDNVILTTDMFQCLHWLSEGNQAVCNFELPYLSPKQISLLNQCQRITIDWRFEKREVALTAAEKLTMFHRFL